MGSRSATPLCTILRNLQTDGRSLRSPAFKDLFFLLPVGAPLSVNEALPLCRLGFVAHEERDQPFTPDPFIDQRFQLENSMVDSITLL
jgi:hypothetical protein